MGADPVLEAVAIGRDALLLAMKLSLPLLLVGLIVGVIVSIMQAATQVQEQTLTFVPKIIAVVAALFVALPWFLTQLIVYTERVMSEMVTRFR
ncbi:MAG: flagellar biosynthesis protein FliQ [Planctomycetota bacterium]|nr:flagellar biosynthesis protein FliQ [Planctomycetota bacterium]